MKRNRATVDRILASAVVFTLLAAPVAFGQERTGKTAREAQMERVTELYAPDAWPASATRGGYALGTQSSGWC